MKAAKLNQRNQECHELKSNKRKIKSQKINFKNCLINQLNKFKYSSSILN